MEYLRKAKKGGFEPRVESMHEHQDTTIFVGMPPQPALELPGSRKPLYVERSEFGVGVGRQRPRPLNLTDLPAFI
ncbi:hypothetical protein WOA01_23015 [Methylocystis sp. IM2]|uniref:hypothetical protein n=1 Tax=Methylocystis sp. IM2 TaxID=3136563 RepID=UPI0030F67A2D